VATFHQTALSFYPADDDAIEYRMLGAHLMDVAPAIEPQEAAAPAKPAGKAKGRRARQC
jgi:hypothetical protein